MTEGRFHATISDVERSGIDDDPLHWFCVQTNPNCEAKALRGLLERGFVAYCPQEIRWHRPTRRGKADTDRVPKARPLLKGYIFVGLCGLQSVYRVRQTDGINRLVSTSDGKPAEIPARLIDKLMDREDRGVFDHTRPTKSRYRPGERVKVVSGPFVGQLGEILEEISDGKLRVEIAGLFGHGAEVPLDDDTVEAIAA